MNVSIEQFRAGILKRAAALRSIGILAVNEAGKLEYKPSKRK